MTNGDFVFFTFKAMRSFFTDKPWNEFKLMDDVVNPKRRQEAFHAVKQVLVFLLSMFANSSCLKPNKITHKDHSRVVKK